MRELPASGAPGLAYAVVTDGEITTIGARGVARIGDDTQVTPDTLSSPVRFQSFTALAVMQLVEEAKIDLDAPVSNYLEAFSAQPAGAITIRQLLSHTSGFSTFQGNASYTDITGGPDELALRVEQLAEVEPAYEPDEKWEYSNTNYQILGRLVEVVGGQDYQTLCHEEHSRAHRHGRQLRLRRRIPRIDGDRAQALVRNRNDRCPTTRLISQRLHRPASSRAQRIWRATCRR